ncbi:MAG: phosphate-starvation-inducible PsiE family protein [Gammaproteobacteria bacterium]|nr:phosphate-starvation-inducible PsiE family protein [Gammaproteobacteria bacterium]
MPDQKLRASGKRAVEFVEDIGLLIILAATLIAGAQEVWSMVGRSTVNLADLLLMFIYLEVVAMVHAYWQAGHLPVRMPLYIAMVALARHLMLDMTHLTEQKILAISGAIVLLGLAVLVVRYGHIRFPYEGSGHK